MTDRFDAYCRRKESAARAARIPGYTTAECRDAGLVGIGSQWSRALFDGDFYRSRVAPADDVPIVSLVFVQSRDGNTIAPDPSSLGGGDTDLHLVYEGLSRVDADAVLAGSATARAKDLVFSVWHPDLVALRLSRGYSRHPAQVVLTARGDLRYDDGLMFQEPELRVFVITRTGAADTIRRRVERRPWIEVVDAGEPMSLRRAMRDLRGRGMHVVSCVGGARTATAFMNERLVSDVYLTTSAIDAGQPDTPYYKGPDLRCRASCSRRAGASKRASGSSIWSSSPGPGPGPAKAGLYVLYGLSVRRTPYVESGFSRTEGAVRRVRLQRDPHRDRDCDSVTIPVLR